MIDVYQNISKLLVAIYVGWCIIWITAKFYEKEKPND